MQKTLIALLTVLCVSAWAAAEPTTQPAIQPTFVELPAMELAGIATFGSPAKGAFGQLWEKWPENVENQPGVSSMPCYGVSLMVPSSKDRKEWSYLAAGVVTDREKAPAFLLRLPVPAGTYAVFRLKGGMPDGLKEMGPTFDYIYSTWLPASGYVIAAPMNLEKYTIDDKNNVIEILIPVKKK